MTDKLMMIYHDLLGNVVALAGIMGVNWAVLMINENFGNMLGGPEMRASILGGLKDFLTMSIYRIFANVPHLTI